MKQRTVRQVRSDSKEEGANPIGKKECKVKRPRCNSNARRRHGEGLGER